MENESTLSDGYHTMSDLYDHRMALFRALTLQFTGWCWRSKKHHDGSMFEGGWFIAGLFEAEIQQITYHFPIKYWDYFDHCRTLMCAPEWDGHTSEDVVERLLQFS